jgi:hypothetical protein
VSLWFLLNTIICQQLLSQSNHIPENGRKNAAVSSLSAAHCGFKPVQQIRKVTQTA